MRKLTLRKEALSELTTDDLTNVVGGAQTQICGTDPCITPMPSRNLGCSFSLSPAVC